MDSSLSIIAGYKQGASLCERSLCVTSFSGCVGETSVRMITSLPDGNVPLHPGILDGDRYHLEIPGRGCCSATSVRRSYQRLFNMEDKATQQLNITMQDNTSFALCTSSCCAS